MLKASSIPWLLDPQVVHTWVASQLGKSASSDGRRAWVALYTHLGGAVQIRLSQRNSSATVSVCRRWEFRSFNIQACRPDRRQRLAQELPTHQACRGEHHAISHARYHVMHHAALGHTALNFTVKRAVYHPKAPPDACFVKEGCLGGTGRRKVHLAVHFAKNRQYARTVERLCMVEAESLHGRCIVNEWYMHGACTVHAWYYYMTYALGHMHICT